MSIRRLLKRDSFARYVPGVGSVSDSGSPVCKFPDDYETNGLGRGCLISMGSSMAKIAALDGLKGSHALYTECVNFSLNEELAFENDEAHIYRVINWKFYPRQGRIGAFTVVSLEEWSFIHAE